MSDPFEAYMETVRTEFRAGLADQRAAIEADWAAAEGGNGSEALKSLMFRAHRLSGNGATFGFVDVSQAAEDLEVAIDAALRETDSEPGELGALVQALTCALTDAIRGAP